MRTYKIHLIRHGITEGNLNGQYIGRTDLPISPSGVSQLDILKNSIEYPYPDKIYSSPLLRAKQTAAIIFPERQVCTINNLTEYDFGEFEGKTAIQLEANEAYALWTAGKIPCPPGGENNTDFIKRICLGINEVVRDMMQNEIYESAVIMHGGTIMSFLANCGLPRRQTVEWATEPGRGYTILVTPSLYQRTGAVEVINEI